MSDRTPRLRYRFSNEFVNAEHLDDGGFLLWSDRGTLARADAATGRLLWTHHDETVERATGVTAVFVVGGRVVYGSWTDPGHRLTALEAKTGRVAWDVDLEQRHGRIAVGNAFRWTATADRVFGMAEEKGILIGVDPADGASRILARRAGIQPLVGVPEAGVFLAYAHEPQEPPLPPLLAFDLATGKLRFEVSVPDTSRLHSLGCAAGCWVARADSPGVFLEIVDLRSGDRRDVAVSEGRLWDSVLVGDVLRLFVSLPPDGGRDSVFHHELSVPPPRSTETIDVRDESNAGADPGIPVLERQDLPARPKAGGRRIPVCWGGADVVVHADTLRRGKGTPWVAGRPTLGRSRKALALAAPGGKAVAVLDVRRLTLVRAGRVVDLPAHGAGQLLAVSPGGTTLLLDTGLLDTTFARLTPLPGAEDAGSAAFADDRTLYLTILGALHRVRAPWYRKEKLGSAEDAQLVAGGPGRLFLARHDDGRLSLARLDVRSGKRTVLFDTEASGDLPVCDPEGLRFAVLASPTEVRVLSGDGTLLARGESDDELEVPGIWSPDGRSIAFWSEPGLACFRFPRG